MDYIDWVKSGALYFIVVILNSFKMRQLPVIDAIMPAIIDCNGGTNSIWQQAEFGFLPNSQMQLISEEQAMEVVMKAEELGGKK